MSHTAIGILFLVALFIAILHQTTWRTGFRCRLIADHSSDLIGLHTPDGDHLWISPSVERILGYTRKEMLKRNAFDFIHPDDQDRVWEKFRNSALAGVRVTYRAQRKDDTFIWLETLTSPLTDRKGRVARILTTSRDVTAQREAEDLYRFLIKNLPDTSVLLFNNHSRHLLAEGPLFGPATSAKGQTLWETFNKDTADTLHPYYQQVFQGRVLDAELVLQTRIYDAHFLPIRDAGGQIRAGLGVLLDITEHQHRMMALEEQTADLERSNRDLEQFANIASHELKSPLRRIASFTDLITDGYKESLPEEAHEYARHVIDGVESLQEVIDSLLVYSRVQTDRTKMAWVNPNESVVQAVKNISGLIREKRARIKKGKLPAMITADAVLLRQLFENLIGNAVKFNSNEKPEVAIRARRNLLDWEFAITDNGPGLDPGYQEKVFTMFQRVHTSIDGSGIGLALCKKIVGIHRGKIWFEAAPKGGTVFKFTLPARSPEDITGAFTRESIGDDL